MQTHPTTTTERRMPTPVQTVEDLINEYAGRHDHGAETVADLIVDALNVHPQLLAHDHRGIQAEAVTKILEEGTERDQTINQMATEIVAACWEVVA
jgi:hypothetical protein